ncbi:hypothetical protein N7454_009904 [Penicillium verhagenii]|nr:hypothetical protein N7454_009904 [Penicillium verhagenii]
MEVDEEWQPAGRHGKGKVDQTPAEVLRGQGPKPAATRGRTKTSPGKQDKIRRSSKVLHQKLNLTTLPQANDHPQLAREDGATDSCHAATEHVIPNVPQQPQSADADPVSHKTKSTKEFNDAIDTAHSSSSVTLGIHRKQVTDTNGDTRSKKGWDRKQGISDNSSDGILTVHTEKIQPESKIQRLRLSMPRKLQVRKKRSAHKTYTLHLKTEVDWNEDLRPTDDDDSAHARSHDAGKSVSTPGHDPTTGEEENSTTLKRKRSKLIVQTSSGKRKGPSKGKAKIQGNSDLRSQLYLSSLAVGPSLDFHAGPLVSDSMINLVPSTQLGETGDEFEDQPPVKMPHENGQIEVIEITSSPVLSEPSSLDYGIDVLRGQTYRVIGTSSDGRGKTVGQKLADALQGVQLHSQLRPAIENTLKSNPKEIKGANHQGVESPLSRMHTTDDSESQDQQVRSQAIKQRQATFGMWKQGQRSARPFQLTPATTLPSEMANFHNTGGAEEFAKRQGSLGGSSFVHIKIGSDGVSDHNHNRNCLDRGHALGSLEPVDETEDSNKGIDQLPGLYRDMKQITRTSIFGGLLAAPKSSIVDSNGSPRLVPQAKQVADETQFPPNDDRMPKRTDIPDTRSSSSDYDKDWNGYSLDSSDDELTWSKYQRDMLKEYGFQTRSTKKSTESRLPEDNPSTNVNPKTLRQQSQGQSSVDSTVPALSRPAASMILGEHAHEVNQSQSVEVGPGLNQIPAKESRTHADQHTLPVAPLTTVISNLFQGAREAQPFSQPSDSDPLDWISGLQNAQSSAHNLLLETNQVRPAI